MSAVFAVYCKCSIAECLTHAWPTDLNIRHFLICKTLSFVCMLFMFWQLSLCWFLTCNYSIYCIILFCIKNFLINYAYIDQLFSLHSTNNINIFIDCKEIYSLLKLVSIWNMISDVIIIHCIKWLKYGKKKWLMRYFLYMYILATSLNLYN